MDEFESTILNVRNSFRLLYFFNRRILDLMKYIGKKFNLRYEGGWSKFSNSSPKDGKGDLDNWAWDWINLYFYEFNFVKEKICFSVFLQSDTGMWDKDVDYLEVEKFENAINSKTKLIFVFNNNGYWDIEKLMENENLKGKYKETFEIVKNKKVMYCMAFDIKDFRNKILTDNSLKRFVEYLNSNEIYDIKITEGNL